MDTNGTGQSSSTLDELLSSYFELCDRRDVLGDRLHRAESAKESVSPRIFEKVRTEYETELESVDGRLAPLKEELESRRRDVESTIEEAESRMRDVEEEMAEARFRFEVGEFDERRLHEIESEIRPRLDDARIERDNLQNQLHAFDRRRDRATETEGANASNPEPGETADWINPRDWAGAPGAGARPDPTTVDPSSAEEETREDPEPSVPDTTHRGDRVTESAKVHDAGADPLVALADPRVESVPDTSPGMPVLPTLVVRSGAHEGRTIPLLPMTMSIGREGDNNIELKDPDVARYHARIVYERGRFSVENLDGSSGTYVNGESTARADLNDGDRLVVGGTELVFELSQG